MIDAGALNERLTIIRPALAADTIGGQTASGQTEVSRWAEIVALEGSELIRAQQVMATLTHKVRVRVRDVQPRDRVRYTRRGVTHTLEVLQVVPIDRDEMQLLCAEELP